MQVVYQAHSWVAGRPRPGISDFSAKFSGFEEVLAAILSAGRATLDLDLNRHARTLGFRLT